MSNNYVQNLLMVELPSGGMLTSAAIFGLDGILWEKSADFPELNGYNLACIINGIDEPSELVANGINLGDQKFFLVHSNPREDFSGRIRDAYLFVAKTHTAIIIGTSRDPVGLGELSTRVLEVGDYLNESSI